MAKKKTAPVRSQEAPEESENKQAQIGAIAAMGTLAKQMASIISAQGGLEIIVPRDQEIKRLSTGSPMLDFLTGGWYRGKFNQIVGPYSSGKSTICLLTAAQPGIKTLWIDMENAFSMEYAESFGVNPEMLLALQPENGEQALRIVRAAIKERLFDLIVIDSIAGTGFEAELAGEIGDNHPGLQARLWNQFFRVIPNSLARSGTTLIAINQIREKIGVMFGSPETTPGGRGKDFMATLTVKVMSQDKPIVDSVTKKVIALRFRAQTDKNRFKAAVKTSNDCIVVRLDTSPRGVDLPAEAVEIAKRLNILTNSKDGKYISGRVFYEGNEIAGDLNILKAILDEDTELLQKILNDISIVIASQAAITNTSIVGATDDDELDFDVESSMIGEVY